MSEQQERRVAVLIDAENIAAKYIDKILANAAYEGRVTVKRIYGDFALGSKSGQARGWNSEVADYALLQVLQIQNTTGKNSSDSALIIDAMDLLYSDTIDVMCIVTNDSDFTRLAMRIANSGLIVIGMGTKDASSSFRSACGRFYFLDDDKTIKKKSAASKNETKAMKSEEKAIVQTETSTATTPEKANDVKMHPVPKNVIDTIVTTIENVNLISGYDDWVNIAQVGIVLHRRFPEFDPSRWNRPKPLSKFLESLDEFEVKPAEAIGKTAGSYIRIR